MRRIKGSSLLNFLGIFLIILVILLLISLSNKKEISGKTIQESEKLKILEDCGENTSIYYSGELCWEKYQMPEPADNWTDAKDYCKNLALANYSDWRLPKLDEFKSIKNYLFTNSSLYRERFFWTSTQMTDYKNAHAFIKFNKDNYYWSYAGDFQSSYGVKCVRENIEIID